MATNTSYINGGSGAGEYSTAAAWEAAVDGTSVAADTERLEISVVGSEATEIVVAGFAARTGSAEIQIECLGAAHHGGNVNATSANAYVIESIRANDGGCRFKGMFADKAIGTATSACFWVGSGGDGNDIFFEDCIANLNGESGTAFLGNTNGTANQYCFSCVALNGLKTTSSDSIGFGSKLVVYNSIAYSVGRGLNGQTYYNCWALECLNDARNATVSYCQFNTENGTITKVIGNNDVAILTDVDTAAANTILVASLTAGAEDFILSEFSDTSTWTNIALGAGNDYSGTFTEQATDIIGTARSAQDVGAYEVIVSGGVTLALPVSTLGLSSPVPTLAITDHVTLALPASTLGLSSPVPGLAITENVLLTLPGSTMGIAAPVPALTITDHIQLGLPVSTLGITAPVPALALTEHVLLTLPASTMGITSPAPGLVLGGNVTLALPASTLGLSAPVPSLLVGGDVVLALPASTLGLSSPAPGINISDHVVLSLPASTLGLSSPVPGLTITENVTLVLPASTLGITSPGPTLLKTEHVLLALDPSTLGLLSPVPGLDVGGNIDARVIISLAATFADTEAMTAIFDDVEDLQANFNDIRNLQGVMQ